MIIGALVGATGVGKTRLALGIAERLGAEIISVDSRQIYRGMAIGTAQPSSQQLSLIKHHLIGFLDLIESYSVARFMGDVHEILHQHPGKKFLLVGGAGLYLQGLMDGLSAVPVTDLKVRDRLHAILLKKGLDWGQRLARRIDPDCAQTLKPGDTQRTIRILEIYFQSGKRWSSLQGGRTGGIPGIPVAWLDCGRERLYAQINQRVLDMLRNGWLEEVRSLYAQTKGDAPALDSLGYRTLQKVLLGELSLESAVAEIQQETRNFAKRQLTWFRNKTPNLRFDLENSGENELILDILRYFEKS